MAEQDEGFLTRWARRKAEPESAEPELQPPPAEAEDKGELTEAEQKALIESLPDVESLDETSDFSAFMQKGVPEALQRRALRKLWRLNPIFANLDGLNDYDDDFTDAATVVEGMKTLFQVGKGMADKPPEEESEADSLAESDQPEGVAEDGALEPEEAEQGEGDSEGEALARIESREADERLGEIETAASDASRAELIHAEVGSDRPASARRWGLPES